VARYRADGTLELLGRLDHQVKIRGFRIELGEIEGMLSQLSTVSEAVVQAHADVSGEKCLVAYIVPAHELPPTIRELRSFLARRLPDYMIPATFVMREALPLTSNGKVDRQALLPPDRVRPELAEAWLAPRTPTEEVLVGIWTTVLGIERIGVHDNFFDLGGHSLMAVQVISRLRHVLQVEMPLYVLFDAPTVAGLALYIEASRQAQQDVQVLPIVPRPRQGATPLSVVQEQLWHIAQLLPGLPLFHMPYAFRLTGALNVAALEQSFNEIIRRHEVLRTTFTTVDGSPVQTSASTWRLVLTVEDLRALPETAQEARAQELMRQVAWQPFDLVHGPLLRVHLLHRGDQEHILLVTMHHIISDGWSIGVLAQELAVLYDALSHGDPSPLPALPIQYADFVHWQRQWQHSEARDAQLAYWQEQLRDPLHVLELATDHPRTGALSLYTARQSLVFPETLSTALLQLSRRESSTLFMTLLAAFQVLLHSYTGQKDQRVATLVANRNRQEVEGLIGLFINTVLLRTDLSGDPAFREVLRRVRATTLAAYAHQDLPFEDLVQALEAERHLKRTSLCQVMLVLQNALLRPLQLPGLTLDVLETGQNILEPALTITTFDIILVLHEKPSGLTCSCIYKTALFEAATIERMLEDFQHTLERVAAQPEQPLSAFLPPWS
jgi:acyl carrier protein